MKRPGRRRWLVVGLAGLCATWVAYTLWTRHAWERDRMVEICVDGEEVRLLVDADSARVYEQLSLLHESGVTSVAVYWDPSTALRSLLDEWDMRIPPEMGITLRPEAVAFSDWVTRWPRAARPPRHGDPVTNVFFSGGSVMGYPRLDTVTDWLEESPYRLPWVEFGRQRGMRALQARLPDRMVRAHTLTEEDMAHADPDRVRGRLRRAVRERGARFLYVRFFPNLSLADNMDFIQQLTASLRIDGWETGPANPRHRDWPTQAGRGAVWARQALAFATAVVAPVWCLAWALKRRHGPLGPLVVMGGSLAGGLTVAALLSTPDFALGFEVFRGVKASFVAPLGAALFLLYRAREVRHFFRERVTVGRLTLGLIVLGGVAWFALQSGHGPSPDPSAMDLTVRGWLESVFGVRPRFKEFLVGHPLLWAGFYLRERLRSRMPLPGGGGMAAQALHFALHDPRPFILLGLLGCLSMVNTFCHAHTPLTVALIRTAHGLWLGAAGGLLWIGALRWGESRWPRLP